MAQPLNGLVASILNERELTINLGSEAGVKPDMVFSVRDETVTVKDPVTGQELGKIDREKIKVKVSAVERLFCIARTFETIQISRGYGFLSNPFERSASFETRVKTFRQSDSNLPEPIDASLSIVKVGDRVEQVISKKE